MSSEADVDRDDHAAPDDDRRRRPPSRWWRSRAQSAADGAIPDTGDTDDEDGDGATRAPAGDPRQELADVGHELKAPLSIMLALCARLEDRETLSSEDAEDVARIRANAYSMLRRVQDLMLVARLENADRQLEAAVVDVAAIVRRCVDGFAELATQRDLDLRLGVPERLAAVADEEKLVSVVSNLMANAIRHAPAGGVVRCSLSTERGRLVLQVADDGPGVPAEQRATIFERYRRGARSAGTGLGLAIVGEIVQLHGGTVAVGDAPEGGALFTVELPLRTQRLSPQRSPAPQRSLALADRQKAIVEELRAELGTAS